MAENVETYAKKRIIRVSSGELGSASRSKANEIYRTNAARGLAERNWQEQCYLMEQAHSLALLRDPGGPHEQEADHYYKIVPPGKHGAGMSQDFSSDIIPSLLSKFSGSDALHMTPPHVVSALVPFIRIYKVIYKQGSRTSQPNVTNAADEWNKKADTDQISIPFDFNVHTTFDSVNDVLKGTSGRTDDVGLKSFSYNFHGKDLVTKDILKCSMSLHFNSVEALVKDRVTNAGPNNEPFAWKWLDLVFSRLQSQDQQNLENLEHSTDPKNYEIKVQIGWSGNASSKAVLAPGDKEAQEAFEAMTGDGFKRTLFLTLISHTIEFNQDGSLDLNIEFIGRSTSRWNTQNWELLYLAKDGKAGIDEYELVELEKETIEDIKELKKIISVEESQKRESDAMERSKKNPGVIDLNVSNAEDYLNAATSSEEAYSKEDEIQAVIGGVQSGEYDVDVAPSSGVDYGQDNPNPTQFDGNKDKVLSSRDVSLSQRELYILQFKLQRIRASRRGLAYQRLFKAMDPILHRIRMARSELGELAEGQLTRAEANKVRQPYYVEHKVGDSGLSDEELKEQNKQWEARSLARASLDKGSDNALTEDERIQQGFGKVLDKGDPDYRDGSNSLSDKYGKNNDNLLKKSVDETNMGHGLIDQEKMKETMAEEAERTTILEGAQDMLGDDPSAATRRKGEPADVMILEYFYLGDLVDQLIKHIKDNPEFAKQRGDDEKKIVFAPMRYEHPLLAGMSDEITTNMFINLADIPISARYFNSWFRTNYILKLQDSITFDSFFKRLIEGLVFGALGEQCYYGSKNAQSNLGLKTLLTKRKISDLPITINESLQKSDRVPNNVFHPSWTEKAFGGTWEESYLNMAGHQHTYEYYVLFANSYVPSFLTANRTRDIAKGIHHIYIGANKGLMKNITFEKISQPSVQAYKIAAAGARDAREIYKMKMSMVGNNYFEPGQLVYINPTFAGLGTAGRRQQIDMIKNLGLGGYYRINTVDGMVESGKFETIVGGYWETFGKTPGASLADETVVSSGFGPLGIGEDSLVDPNKEPVIQESTYTDGGKSVGPFN